MCSFNKSCVRIHLFDNRLIVSMRRMGRQCKTSHTQRQDIIDIHLLKQQLRWKISGYWETLSTYRLHRRLGRVNIVNSIVCGHFHNKRLRKAQYFDNNNNNLWQLREFMMLGAWFNYPCGCEFFGEKIWPGPPTRGTEVYFYPTENWPAETLEPLRLCTLPLSTSAR